MSADPRTPTFRDLADKVVLVTGGSRGIGAATCAALGANGARVAVAGRDRDAVEHTVSETEAAGGQATGVLGDCTDPRQLAAMRDEIERALGPVDAVAAFAGGFTARTPLLEISLEEWEYVLKSNLTSSLLTLQAFAPAMIDRGGGAFVLMSSNAGRFLDITLTASYAAAKAGVVMLARHAAKELGPANVRVNCVAPATTLTERVSSIMDEETRSRIAAMSPLGRLGAPQDSAWAALYLISDASAWLTGVTLDIAGGRIML
jgi:3-oxoacyl-[acyl-carrier protein] reductase